MGSSVLGDRPFHHALLGRRRASAGSAYSPVDTSSGAECDPSCRHLWSIHHELRPSLRSQDLNLDSQSALLHSQVPAVTSPIYPEGNGDHPNEQDPREMGWGKSPGPHPHPKWLPRFSSWLTASPTSFRGALGKAPSPGISTSGWQSCPPQINPRGTQIGSPNQKQVVSACRRGGSPATEGSRPEDPGGGLRGAPGVRKANMGLQDMVLSSSEFNS